MEKIDQFPEPHDLAWIYTESLEGLMHIAPRLGMTKELRKIGWRVTFLSPGQSGNHTINGVEITCLPRPAIYVLGQIVFHFRVIGYLLKRWDSIDFILFHQSSLPWVLLMQLIRNSSARIRPLFIMDSRTIPMEGKSATVKDRLRSIYSSLMNGLANQLVDGQTTITHRMADVLQIPAEKLWGIWPSGVDIDTFLPAKASRCWPQDEQPVKIVYLGILAVERNVMALCQAVVKANQEGMHFELFLVGDGKERENLEEFAGHSDGKIHIVPTVPHPQVPEILAGMHIGALPFADEQKFRVSSPIKLFEYMGSGIPVLATRIVCHTDVIGNQPCAFWAEDSNVKGLFDALRDVWKKRDTLASMGAAATGIAKEYTWAASAKKLAIALEKGLAVRQRKLAAIGRYRKH